MPNAKQPDPDAKQRVIPSTSPEANAVLKLIMDDVEAADYPKDAAFAIRLALDEALANAVRHGNAGDASKTVTIDWSVTPQLTTISIEDQGPGFIPGDLPDPTLDENLTRPCGRGVMLMRAYMDEVTFNKTGNRVTLKRRRDPATAST
ncbi:MAG: ATP-binding protein [Planctomycetota bacterium]